MSAQHLTKDIHMSHEGKVGPRILGWLGGHSAEIYLQGYMSAQYPSSVFSSDGSLKFHRSEIFHQRFLFGSHARFLPFNLIHTLRVQNSWYSPVHNLLNQTSITPLSTKIRLQSFVSTLYPFMWSFSLPNPFITRPSNFRVFHIFFIFEFKLS